MTDRGKQTAKSNQASSDEQEFSVERPDGAVALWSQVVTSLKHSGFEQAGQAYLQLSRMIRDVRTAQLVRGETDDAGWTSLRQLAREAHTILEPVVKAAQVLAELPAPAPDLKAPEGPAAPAASPKAALKTASNGSAATPEKAKARKAAASKTTPPRKPNAARAAARRKSSP